jgi:hypothetical protein
MSAARLPPPARPAILGGMGGKLALTLLNCVIGPALILGGLALAIRIGDRDPVAGFTLVAITLILPVLVITRVSWAAGYAAGKRDRAPDPPAG